jgi:hypothetical protein
MLSNILQYGSSIILLYILSGNRINQSEPLNPYDLYSILQVHHKPNYSYLIDHYDSYKVALTQQLEDFKAINATSDITINSTTRAWLQGYDVMAHSLISNLMITSKHVDNMKHQLEKLHEQQPELCNNLSKDYGATSSQLAILQEDIKNLIFLTKANIKEVNQILVANDYKP